MPDGTIVNFELNLPLPTNARDAKISPSTYWGIAVARSKQIEDALDRLGTSEDLIVEAFGSATDKARDDNDRRGLPTPVRGEDGKVAHRLRGRLVTPEGR